MPSSHAAPALSGDHYPQQSRLFLRAGLRGARTELDELYYTPPFKLTSPFFPAGSRETELILMSVSAGLLAGDRQQMEIELQPGARLSITSQSYEKVHRMPEGAEAVRTTRILLAGDTLLDYRPQPLIPFAGSAFCSANEIHLAAETSSLIFADIISAGRIARGEAFSFRRYQSRTSVFLDGRLIYLDHIDLQPGHESCSQAGYFEKYTHLATMVAINCGEWEEKGERIRQLRQLLEERKLHGGVSTTFRGDLTLRLLGFRGQDLVECLGAAAAILKGG